MDAHKSPAPLLEEPQTPLGLTLFGIGLLLAGATYWVWSASETPSDSEGAARPAAATEAAP